MRRTILSKLFPTWLRRDIVLERRLLDAAQLDRILAVDAMTRPGIAGGETKQP